MSTAEQGNEDASPDAQRVALTAEAARRGWDLEIVADAGYSAKSPNRPALGAALARLNAGDADALLSIRLDRVSRSVTDFAGLLARAKRRGCRIVLLSPNLDTEDAAEKFTAHVLAAAAEYERDLIGARTRERMLQRNAEGVHIGRPRTLPDEARVRIARERGEGVSLGKIAAGLNADGIVTAHGGREWYASAVSRVLGA